MKIISQIQAPYSVDSVESLAVLFSPRAFRYFASKILMVKIQYFFRLLDSNVSDEYNYMIFDYFLPFLPVK